MRKPNLRRRGNPPPAPAPPQRQPDGLAEHAEYSAATPSPPGTWVPAPLTSEAYEPPPRLNEPNEPYPPRQPTQPLALGRRRDRC